MRADRALLAATALALACANSPLRHAYETVRTTHVPLLHLDVAGLVAEGLLTVFFFVAGLEVKREVVAGELRRHATLPVVAALCGMVAPALVFLAIAPPGAGRGWAVPVATDVAFALGVLSLAGSSCPPSLRTVLLSLAVVDDVGAIALVAVLFGHDLRTLPLLGALIALALYAVAARHLPYAAVPLAVVTWLCLHAGGIHPTVAGVLLALLTPYDLTSRLERRLQPWSDGVVVLFAFTAAGVALSPGALTDRVAVAVFVALVGGKLLGIAGGCALVPRPADLTRYDTLCLGALGGVGFTVSLLLADLAYDGARAAHAKTAVLAASVCASLIAAALLRRPSRTRRQARRAVPPTRR